MSNGHPDFDEWARDILLSSPFADQGDEAVVPELSAMLCQAWALGRNTVQQENTRLKAEIKEARYEAAVVRRAYLHQKFRADEVGADPSHAYKGPAVAMCSGEGRKDVKHPEPTKGGDEYDAFTGWRKLLHWGACPDQDRVQPTGAACSAERLEEGRGDYVNKRTAFTACMSVAKETNNVWVALVAQNCALAVWRALDVPTTPTEAQQAAWGRVVAASGFEFDSKELEDVAKQWTVPKPKI